MTTAQPQRSPVVHYLVESPWAGYELYNRSCPCTLRLITTS
jgi:hypothetical protein